MKKKYLASMSRLDEDCAIKKVLMDNTIKKRDLLPLIME